MLEAGQDGQLTPKYVLVADQCGNVGRVIARKLSISQRLEIDENVVLLVELVVTVVEVVSFYLE